VAGVESCENCYMGDSVRLQQILINILTNAVKFTPKGGTVRLDISQVDSDEKTANICFEISDTGIGIGEAFLPNVFKPFVQEHSGSTSSYGGSGLQPVLPSLWAGILKSKARLVWGRPLQ
ncbi:MAG: ATP-binding protein, partial [Christensenella sp.]